MKKQRIFFIFLKIILLVILAVFFYFQIKKIDLDQDHIYLVNPFFLVLVILLMPVNWFLEWLKWVLTMSILEIRTPDRIRGYSFFAGIITGMLTPNMLGNFIGRVYYFERRYRIPIIILTLISNYAQFIASILFGILGIIFINKTPLDIDILKVNWILMAIAFLMILFYFNFEWVFKFSKRKSRIFFLIQKLKGRRSYRWKISLISILRHSIFSLQFIFMLHAFGEELSMLNVLWVWQVYFWVTIAPSLFLGKLAIRESISIWVLAFAGMNELTILFSSFLIWTINLLIPTLISLLICKRKR